MTKLESKLLIAIHMTLKDLAKTEKHPETVKLENPKDGTTETALYWMNQMKENILSTSQPDQSVEFVSEYQDLLVRYFVNYFK